MLHIDDAVYFATVQEFAKRVGKVEDLEGNLTYLRTYACSTEDGVDETRTRCVIYKDSAPYSFAFTMYKKNRAGEYERWFNGGLIFHGSHDDYGSGSAPTFSVTLSPTDGWSIHT